MPATPAPVSRRARLAGRLVSAVPVLFLTMDGVMKLALPKPVVDGSLQLGFSLGVIPPIGIVLLAWQRLLSALEYTDARRSLAAARVGDLRLRAADAPSAEL